MLDQVALADALAGDCGGEFGDRLPLVETGKPQRFLCLIGEKGKVLLTFFTDK